MFHIVLLEPRMPGNVGTIGRLAVATGCTLHLIKPYGFKAIDEEKVILYMLFVCEFAFLG